MLSQEQLTSDGSHSQTHTHTHTHTHTTWEWVHVTMRGRPLSPPFSLTQGLQHFLPAHHEILKPGPTASHGDRPEEVRYSPVSHFSFIRLPLESTIVQDPFFESKRRHSCPLKPNSQDALVCPLPSCQHVILACRVRGPIPTEEKTELSLCT